MTGRGRGSRSGLLLVVKVAIGAALCAVIAARIDWREALATLSTVGWVLVAVMFSLLLLNIFLSAYKWRLLLKIHGIDYSFGRLSRYYFVAQFLNNFLPTSIGGDGYRVYKTLDNGRSKTSALVAVAMERLTGLGSLVALGLVGAVVLAGQMQGDVANLVIATSVACLAAPAVAWFGRGIVPAKLWELLPPRIAGMVTTIGEHADDYSRQPGRTLGVVAISVGFHLILALSYLTILRYGTGEPVTILQLLVVLAMSNLVAVLPISINGIGVFEGTFMYLLAQYGVPYEVSIVPMILNRGLIIVFGLMGAGVYLLDGIAWRQAKAA